MTEVRRFSNARAEMTVESLGNKYVVHMSRGCSLDLMKEVFHIYKDKNLFACLPKNSRINGIARVFGELALEYGNINIYHIKGD